MDERADVGDGDGSAHTTNRKSARSARVEIITRGERRRRWTLEQKREIVAESYGTELTPTEVARKHGISSGQLYTWRRELLEMRTAVLTRAVPQFAEVEVAGAIPSATTSAPTSGTVERQAALHPSGCIEIVLPGDVVVRVDAQVNGAALRRVLDALERR
jgi:transposase